MTHLQKIVAEAKKMRKAHPKKYDKWTDYIKAASKKVKPAKKTISPRKRPIIKMDKEFEVARTKFKEFNKVKRISGVGAIKTSLSKMANDLSKELTKILADAKKIPAMKKQLTKLKKASK